MTGRYEELVDVDRIAVDGVGLPEEKYILIIEVKRES